MSLRVVHPGTFSLLVDRGRPATRSLGVAVGGAADRAAYALGNALVGNESGAVALEISLSGPTLVAEHDVSACVFGSPLQATIDGQPAPVACVVHLRAGETLHIGGTGRGARAYLCVHGGFATRSILGSGTALAPLAEGEELSCPPAHDSGRSLEFADVASLLDERSPNGELRIVPGPQADWFAPDLIYRDRYSVAPASNRMGVRLQGQPLVRPARELVSEAVAPGAVQITNEGLPIILGVDGQTIGGYPKIAHVIRADLDRVGQLRPGDSVRFVAVTAAQAESLAADRQHKLRRWLTALRLAAL